MGKKSQHVVPTEGRWRVIRSGASKASRTFSTQREAIDHARDLARTQRTELYVHGKDGRIRERSSFGEDKAPPKG